MSTTKANNDNKKPSKFKGIFRSHIDTVTFPKRTINRFEISPPVVQHSTSIFSLVSPIRPNSRPPQDLYRPKSSPPLPPPPPPPFHSASPSLIRKYLEQSNSPKPSVPRRHSFSSLYPNILPNPKPHRLSETRRVKVSLVSSQSVPLGSVKKYNVPKKSKIEDKEKIRKMKEFEDLITGRRERTLKLTLTPKGLI